MNSRETQHEMECSRFESLLAEALDGTLTQEMQQAFDAHRDRCPVCGPLFAETREGMLLMATLPELEPPQNLVHNILAATSMAEARAEAPEKAAPAGWLDRLRLKLPAPLAAMLNPRFATSFAMAFFSLSLTLNLMGVKASDITRIDWHPSALRKSAVLQYTQIEARVQRYYDNMRLVYEVQSRVQGLRKAATPSQENKDNNKREQQNRNTTPDTSGRPQEHEDYSRYRDGSLMAKSTAKHEGAQI